MGLIVACNGYYGAITWTLEKNDENLKHPFLKIVPIVNIKFTITDNNLSDVFTWTILSEDPSWTKPVV